MCSDWNKLAGSSKGDHSNAIALDPPGNILVAGRAGDAYGGETWEGGDDALLIKYDAAGNEIWAVQFGTAGADVIHGVGADSAGNVFVAGFFAEGVINGQPEIPNGTDNDGFVSKYDANGIHQWTQVFGSTANDTVGDLAVDMEGAVYVVGRAAASVNGLPFLGGPEDLLLIKYDKDGVEQWTRLWGSDGADAGFSVATDGMGAVYAVGYSGGEMDGETNSGNLDIMLVKYDSNGGRQWTRLLGTSTNDFGTGVAVDGAGGVFVAGHTLGVLPGQQSAGGLDVVVARYNPTGDLQWTYQAGSPENDYARRIAADGAGSIYVTGWTKGALPNQTSLGGDDMLLISLASDGAEVWTHQLGSSGTDQGLAITTGNEGGVYVSGLSDGDFETEVNTGNLEIAVVSICD